MKVDKRSELKQSQIDILELIYKYRFGSRQLLADSLSIKADSLFRKLEVLIKHGYINKRLDKKLKLLGTPAAYYITPKGIRTLQKLPKYEHITDSSIKSSYKDKAVGQSFIDHTLNVYALNNKLIGIYPALKVFLKRDMSRYSYFPDNSPDAFLSLPKDKDTPNRYFLDLIPSSIPSKAIFVRITNYANFFEEGGWDPTNSKLPVILLAAEDGATERRVRKLVNAAIYKADIDEELEVYTTTNKAVSSMPESQDIWTNIADVDELYPLDQI